MNDCLVTKLNSVVENDNLEYLDGFKVHVKEMTTVTEHAHSIFLGSVGINGLLVVGNGSVTVGGNTYTAQSGKVSLSGSIMATFSNNTFDVVFFGKYNLPKILADNVNAANSETFYDRGLEFDLDSLAYSDDMEHFAIVGANYHGRFRSFKKMKWFYLYSQYPNGAGQIKCYDCEVDGEDIRPYNSLQIFKCKYTSRNDYTASRTIINVDLSDFANHTSITMISAPFSQITGDMRQLMAAQVAKGRTSGTIDFDCETTLITLDGVAWTPANMQTLFGATSGVYRINGVFDQSKANGYYFTANGKTLE